MSHFYLSHVRTVDEEWVASFFHDLRRVVAERTGRSPEVVGVRGKPHSPDVSVDLLGRSTVLVVLHSPRYFSQSYCRAELSHFQRRLNMQRSRTGHSTDAVVPVMWEPDPTHALDTVVPYPPLGTRSGAYRRDGLLHLLRLKARYRSEYEEVLRATADRIVVAAERLPEVHGFDVAGSHSSLDELLHHALLLMRGQHSEYDRWGLPDAESLTSSLRKVLIRLQNEALKSMHVVRPPATSTEGLHTFPLLGRYSS